MTRGAWPQSDLEHLGGCPVCGAVAHEMLFEGLVDEAFMCAPGKWDMHRCTQCRNAYLNPRPSRASIGAAYESYYTHEGTHPRVGYSLLAWPKKLSRRAANAYANRRYATDWQPSTTLLGWVVDIVPGLKSKLDIQFRWLPRPDPGALLLDVGCGSGAFLRCAAAAGWKPHGAEPDPRAAAQASLDGADVRVGDIREFISMENRFQAITFSHSIEHVHDPVEDLRLAYRLLAPGGVLYVDTPDLDCLGRTRFGRHWRGLEAPRHLVLFSRAGLLAVLRRVGFDSIVLHPRYAVSRGMFLESSRLAGRATHTWTAKLQALFFALSCRLNRRPEFVTLTCRKPLA